MAKPRTQEDFHTKPSWKGWKPPVEPMYLYHVTSARNLKSIQKQGLLPFGETDKFKKPAVWMTDKVDFALGHFQSRHRGTGAKPVLLKVRIDPEKVGLHQAMVGFPNVFTSHEPIPPEDIEVMSGMREAYDGSEGLELDELYGWIDPDGNFIKADVTKNIEHRHVYQMIWI